MNLKLLTPLLGFVVGVLLADLIGGGIIIFAFALAVSLFSWIIISKISRNPFKSSLTGPLHSVWIFCLFFGVGALDYDTNGKLHVEKDLEGGKYWIKGEIEDVKYLADGDKFYLHVVSISDSTGKPVPSRNLNMLIKTDGYSGAKGDLISFETIPYKFKDPYFTRMKHQGIAYGANLKTDKVIKTGENGGLFTLFNSLRNSLIIKIEKSHLHRATSEFLISILLGDKSLLDSNVKTTLTLAGMAHILALSGMHVAIMLSIFLCILYPLSFFGLRKTRRIIALSLIWIYVLITGCSPSTVRAALMASFVVLAFVCERKNSAMNALLASVLIILIFNPLALWNLGLQLSFVCVASILLFNGKLNPVDRHAHGILYKTVNSLLIILITTFSTWTLVAYYFGNVPLLFLPANLILLPLLPLFTGLGALYVALLAVGLDSHFMAMVIDFYFNNFIGAADFLSLSGNSFINIDIPTTTVISWLIAIILFALFLYSSQKIIKRIYATTALGLMAYSVFSLLNFTPTTSTSLKFTRNFASIESRYRENGETIDLSFPHYTVSNVSNEKMRIISIDQTIHPDSLTHFVGLGGNIPHFLIIGANADLEQMASVISNSRFEKVILHYSVSQKKKETLLSLLDVSLWDNIYSLRENGSLEFEL